MRNDDPTQQPLQEGRDVESEPARLRTRHPLWAAPRGLGTPSLRQHGVAPLRPLRPRLCIAGRRLHGDGTMTAATHLTLVPQLDSGNDQHDNLSPLELWELYMRGGGRSNRTISETILVMGQLERHADRSLECMRAIDVARFLGRSRLNQNSRSAYYGYIRAFYRWWGDNGGVNVTATLPRPEAPRGVPRPITDKQLNDLLAVRMHKRTRVMILARGVRGPAGPRNRQDPRRGRRSRRPHPSCHR